MEGSGSGGYAYLSQKATQRTADRNRTKSASRSGRRGGAISDAESLASTVFSATGSARKLKRTKVQHTSLIKNAIRWMEKTGQQAHVLPCLLLFILCIKLSVGLGSFSGEGNGPLYGDMEAQRNWLSVTLHMPIREWYTYNLQHWGLDYPPLTAYHSWALGWIIHHLPFSAGRAVVALRESGQVAEEQTVKLWMRHSVIFSELFVWFPAVIWGWVGFVLNGGGSGPKRSSRTKAAAMALILLQPANILIDNGHFQYNTIMLSFTLLAVVFLHKGSDSIAAICFVSSLCFKQMALYYAPAIFAYLLGKCFWLGADDGLKLFATLGMSTGATFLLFFSPFLYPLSNLGQAIHRIFPFSRGLFEDKVANFWCAVNTFVKLRNIASSATLAKLALCTTLLAVLPMMVGMIYLGNTTRSQKEHRSTPPTLSLLLYALLYSSLAFFLFSFQVHEKSILLPLMPATLLMASEELGAAGQVVEWCTLLINVAIYSMWPLLKKDGLGVQYVTLTLLWNYLFGQSPLDYEPSFVKLLTLVSYGLIAILHLLDAVSTPPPHLPDLFIVLNLTFSAAVFGLILLWSAQRMMEEGWNLTASFGSAHIGKTEISQSIRGPREYGQAGLLQAVPLTRQHLSAISQRRGSDYSRTSKPSDAGSTTSAFSKSRRRRKEQIVE